SGRPTHRRFGGGGAPGRAPPAWRAPPAESLVVVVLVLLSHHDVGPHPRMDEALEVVQSRRKPWDVQRSTCRHQRRTEGAGLALRYRREVQDRVQWGDASAAIVRHFGERVVLATLVPCLQPLSGVELEL